MAPARIGASTTGLAGTHGRCLRDSQTALLSYSNRLQNHKTGSRVLSKRSHQRIRKILWTARHPPQRFNQPDLRWDDIRLTLDEESRTITSAVVEVDAVCGCARHVAEKLIGLSADEAEEKAGLFHHHFPCLASMVKLNDYNHDTLMHESGHLLQDNLAEQLKPYKQTKYIAPTGKVDQDKKV